MRINVSINQDVEVDVSALEVLSQLPGETDHPELTSAVTGMLSRCLSCLLAVPDDTLGRLKPDVRAQLVTHLRAQADRYEIKVAEAA